MNSGFLARAGFLGIGTLSVTAGLGPSPILTGTIDVFTLDETSLVSFDVIQQEITGSVTDITSFLVHVIGTSLLTGKVGDKTLILSGTSLVEESIRASTKNLMSLGVSTKTLLRDVGGATRNTRAVRASVQSTSARVVGGVIKANNVTSIAKKKV